MSNARSLVWLIAVICVVTAVGVARSKMQPIILFPVLFGAATGILVGCLAPQLRLRLHRRDYVFAAITAMAGCGAAMMAQWTAAANVLNVQAARNAADPARRQMALAMSQMRVAEPGNAIAVPAAAVPVSLPTSITPKPAVPAAQFAASARVNQLIDRALGARPGPIHWTFLRTNRWPDAPVQLWIMELFTAATAAVVALAATTTLIRRSMQVPTVSAP